MKTPQTSRQYKQQHINECLWLCSSKTLFIKKAVDQIWPMGHSLLTPSLDHASVCTIESISNNISGVLSTWLNSENGGYNLYLLFLLFKLFNFHLKKTKTCILIPAQLSSKE